MFFYLHDVFIADKKFSSIHSQEYVFYTPKELRIVGANVATN